MHSVTDGRTDGLTDRQHYHANSLSYCVQYDRLKSETLKIEFILCRLKSKNCGGHILVIMREYKETVKQLLSRSCQTT